MKMRLTIRDKEMRIRKAGITDEQIRHKILLAKALGLEAFKCPTTGNIIDGAFGDDKAMCGCVSARLRGGTHHRNEMRAIPLRDYVIEHFFLDLKLE